jgi:hypothetical protein
MHAVCTTHSRIAGKAYKLLVGCPNCCTCAPILPDAFTCSMHLLHADQAVLAAQLGSECAGLQAACGVSTDAAPVRTAMMRTA